MTRNLTILTLTALLTTGCLTGESEHTIYLEPDGSATWMVLEKDVRSDSGDLNEEEKDLLEPLRLGEHHVAEALCEIGAVHATSSLIRAERPYWVMTNARFLSVATALEGFLREVGVDGEAWLEHTLEETRLAIRYRPETDDCDDEREDVEIDRGLNALLEDELRIFLTSGKFTDATGFEISDDGAVATPLAFYEEDLDADGRVTLSLTWTVQE